MLRGLRRTIAAQHAVSLLLAAEITTVAFSPRPFRGEALLAL